LTTNWFRNLGQWFLYGGSTTLRPYERAILEHAAAQLSAADSSALLQQVRSFDRVQRSLDDRMVLFHFRTQAKAPSLLSAPGDAHCVAKLTCGGTAGRSNAAVITHHGLLSSLEFSRPPKALLAGEVKVLDVARDSDWTGPAEAADRVEHGSES
jgi:hypothetical protein